ncbi:fimbrial biogenesis chaperone [Hafnia alvei]|uniref:Fimbrial chaperone protein n=1 Tax=Hafnia alvei TaxID=569 RepID=A0A1C6YVT4_HAFAL|nr:molecular chaperone [Hafnia alvei]NLS56251.1 fimbria/pilus periplasmic chaperone [Hafnia alvei]SCM50963.1 fimbrial chaperone protein [Hafnia alvei]
MSNLQRATHHLCIILGSALLSTIVPVNAYAATNMLIWPIDPALGANDNATELWLENKGAVAATMQIRVLGWKQVAGEENYRSQQDVVASPPIVNIGAGKKQLIRLIRQSPTPAGQEQAFRILIDEVPPAERSTGSQAGVSLLMRYSLPLFVYGDGVNFQRNAAEPVHLSQSQLSWKMTTNNGHPAIEVTNRGTIHARLSKVSINGKTMADGLLGYVLAGSYRTWPLPAGVTRGQMLKAEVNSDSNIWQSGPAQ